MKFIASPHNSVYFNLALEDYLLHQTEDDYVLIYENADAVVLGKHQNAFAECRIGRCEELNVKIARRLSGGGTVYHGPGNINFSFIRNLEDGEPMIDFQRNLEPVIKFLRSIDINAEFSGRNDILVNGLKVSGNAEHVYQRTKRLIHHGTLLYDADLKRLSSTTEQKEGVEFKTHAVQSVRSTVANLKRFQSDDWNQERFVKELSEYLTEFFQASPSAIDDSIESAVGQLIKEKYGQNEWILGYSPTFTLIDGDIEIEVKKGVITKCSLGHQYEGKTFERQSFIESNVSESSLNLWF